MKMSTKYFLCLLFLSAFAIFPSENASVGSRSRETRRLGSDRSRSKLVPGLSARLNAIISRMCLDETDNCMDFRTCCGYQCGDRGATIRCTANFYEMIARCDCNEDPPPSQWPGVDEDYPTVPPASGNDESESSGMCGRPTVAPHSADSIQKGSIMRIVGGQNTIPNSWPWQVSLQVSGRHECGGSLIDSIHVLTAAHCLGNKSISQFIREERVVLGLHDLDNPGAARTISIRRVTKHPNYNNKTMAYDLAILRLATPVSFSKTIGHICLPQNETQPGQQCVVTGWGQLYEGKKVPPAKLLQQTVVPILSTATCNNKQHYNGQIESSSMFCAGDIERDACQGDSGGPLVCQRSDGVWELQGVVSWGEGCGRKPGVYANVHELKDWIWQNLR